ncbi:ATP-binding cassette domain-containing protein [Thermosipho ferrireducens]|uniref:ATP-binding cassette domain-containing protein n=1 Tax=Thermosipho ferrireducens TaxID=2571116 RepID=A0ABX7SAA0_9BACT|nr:ATP-binding cassette domain-containing protein [Thermosipho ferrireducens]
MPLDELMGLISVVEQEPKFFSNGFIENLKMANEKIDKEKIFETAKKLGIEEFVRKLFSRNISSCKLSKLSGGERKRLGILRGILKDTPIIIMDEPTAFLDNSTAKIIIENINKNFKDKTILIFSHDPIVLDFSDEIIKI